MSDADDRARPSRRTARAPAMPGAPKPARRRGPLRGRAARHAATIAASSTVSDAPPDRSTASSTSLRARGRRCGSPTRPCRAARRPAPARMRGSAPARSAKPCAYARVLPPPPYGSASTSGVPPSCSRISNAAVFWPSMRCGFVELTSACPSRSASSRRIGERVGRTCRRPRRASPPTARTCASFAAAAAPAATTIDRLSPARAA